MAKLYFYYSAMNAGKSTLLLQSAFNYKESGMETLLFTPAIDTRYEYGKIYSRIGIHAEAQTFHAGLDLLSFTKKELLVHPDIKCILVDEAQFLTKEQAAQLTNIVDELKLPVLAYGIRSDFRGQAFEGSMYLLIWADHIIELKTICHCGKKAIMNARYDKEGNIITSGSQVQIGGKETYVSLCRKHFKEALQLSDLSKNC